MLELAYWIGPRPGVYNPDMDANYALESYRDRREWGRDDPDQRDR